MTSKLPFKLDLNFYPERQDEAHWILMQILDGCGDCPVDLTLRQMIQAVVDGDLLLWDAMYEVDYETGDVVPRRWMSP